MSISLFKKCVETIFNAFLRNYTFLVTLPKPGRLPNTGTVTLANYKYFSNISEGQIAGHSNYFCVMLNAVNFVFYVI